MRPDRRVDSHRRIMLRQNLRGQSFAHSMQHLKFKIAARAGENQNRGDRVRVVSREQRKNKIRMRQ